jgi:hypothetical protein
MRLVGQHADGATAARWEGAHFWASCGRASFRLGGALLKPPLLELRAPGKSCSSKCETSAEKLSMSAFEQLAEKGRVAESVNPTETHDKGTHMCPAARSGPCNEASLGAPVTSQGPAV